MIGPGLFRLILAFVVILHHTAPLRLGQGAVLLFFTISGYWRALKCKNMQIAPGVLGRFSFGRWWRLAPVCLICTLIASAVSDTHRFPGFGEVSAACWFLRQIPIVGAALVQRILPVAWTFDGEIQFYLVPPFLVAGWRRLPRSE